MNTIQFERLWELAIEDADPTDDEMYLTVMDETVRKQWETLITIRDLIEDAEAKAEDEIEQIGPSDFRDEIVLEALKAPEVKEKLAEFIQSLPFPQKEIIPDNTWLAPVKPVDPMMAAIAESRTFSIIETIEDWIDQFFSKVENPVGMAALTGEQVFSLVREAKWISPHDKDEVITGRYSKRQDGCVFKIRWPDGFNGKALFFGKLIQVENVQTTIYESELISLRDCWREGASLQIFNPDKDEFEPWTRLAFE